jgi:hypothetical protein
MLLAGDLGCYILGFYDLEPIFVELYARLYRCMEGIMRYGHSFASLATLEKNMEVVLGDAEGMLPIMWCTGVRHQLLHGCAVIRLCGPFYEHNMLIFERWHTIFKRLARGRRNVIASIHNHWCLVLASAAWRLPSSDGEQWSAKGFRSSLAGATPKGYTSKTVFAVGARRRADIPLAGYQFLQDLYASRFVVYDKLRERYRRKMGWNPITSREQIPMGYDGLASGLRGAGGAALNMEELNWLKMNTIAYSYERATINDAKFCTTAYCKELQYDNSVIKLIYNDADAGDNQDAYAWIKKMFVHEHYPGNCNMLYPVRILLTSAFHLFYMAFISTNRCCTN